MNFEKNSIDGCSKEFHNRKKDTACTSQRSSFFLSENCKLQFQYKKFFIVRLYQKDTSPVFNGIFVNKSGALLDLVIVLMYFNADFD